MPSNVFSWKLRKSWRNRATVEENAAPRVFAAEFIRIDDFRIELEVADQRLRPADAANGTIGDLSAERSRLNPPAL